MAKLFNSIPGRKPKLNKFDLSHERKMSLNMGDLVPIMVQEIIPGDRFRVNTEIMMRLAPMLAPIMHRVNVYTHYFFVPNRLVWNEWEDFITGGREGTSEPTIPYWEIATPQSILAGSLADYMGLPLTDDAQDNQIFNMLAFRAYQLIYDNYYRDQNVSASIDISKAGGAIAGAELTKLLTLRKRAWEKDYFTSALPFAQRGAPVTLPIDPVLTYKPTSTVIDATTNNPALGPSNLQVGAANGDLENAVATNMRIENIDSITAASITINTLRVAVRLQEYLENNARAGGRYVEQLAARWGIISSDARLQRPEYLGGGRTPVVISEVLKTTEEGTTPQGDMTGHGMSVGSSNGFSRRFEEHGYVIGIMSVLPKTAYQQGIPLHFSRVDKLQFAIPEFGHLGEQEVKNKEVFWDGDPVAQPAPDGTFGYQSRFAEYKYGCSSVHGDFRTNLAFWHMGRIFSAAPALNAAFIESDPTHRIFAVTDPAEHKLWVQLYNRVDALRPLPYFGVPTI